MYYVYILECRNKALYTGITTDVARRVKEHKLGVGARYTKAMKVRRLVYSEPQPDRSSALKREFQIKHLSRAKKLALITTDR